MNGSGHLAEQEENNIWQQFGLLREKMVEKFLTSHWSK